MLSTRTIIVRAVVTAIEVTLAAVLVGGLTPADLSLDALELAVLAGVGAGLSVVYNSLRQWLEQTNMARTVRALRAERDRQLAEQDRAAVALDESGPWGRAAGRPADELPADEDPGEILDLSAGTRRRGWRPGWW